MANWIPFKHTPFRGGGRKTLATLTGDSRRPILLIGALLREQGFDVTKKYELFYDPDGPLLGLKESTGTNAFKVSCQRNQTRTSKAYSMQFSGFVRKFKLTGTRYAATRATLEDGVWILALAKVHPDDA